MCTTNRRCDSTRCRAALKSLFAAKADSELALLLTAQHGNPADPLEIRIEAADRAGQGEVTVTGDEGGGSGH